MLGCWLVLHALSGAVRPPACSGAAHTAPPPCPPTSPPARPPPHLQTQTLAFNGTKWGPTLRLSLGQLYQIDVTNADIAGGTSVHWHGQHVANASWADGAQGLTQGAIPPGGTFSYRFAAGPAGVQRPGCGCCRHITAAALPWPAGSRLATFHVG